MQRTLFAALLAFASLSPSAGAAGHQSGQSALSDASANLSGVVVAGSILTVAATGSVVVASVRTVGEGLEVVLDNVANGSRATVRLSGKAAGGVSLAAGATLEIVSAATGHVLAMSGKAIAFLPNEAGKALLHHARAG